MQARRALTGRGAALLLALALFGPGARAEGPYSPGGWPTLHRDPGNARAAPASVLQRRFETWQTLEGATVLTAPTTSPDGRRLYVATGRGAGHSNLHAFTIDGELLWRSEPWHDPDDGVDPCAVLSSPIVDEDGDVYLGDCNQLWAFRPDGRVKWVAPLPAPREGDWVAAGDHPVNAFTTAVFTADGHVAGVTNFGDVVVLDRASGAVRNEPFRLPGALPPASEAIPLPGSLFADGLLDLRFREWAWQLLFGGRMRSANTPAVSRSGRIFVVGSGAERGFGALYALELESGADRLRVRQVYATPIGLGSGSSPALSPDQSSVYVSDEEGWLYAIDTETGDVAWKVQTRATAAAAAVGSDGTVYALQANAPAVVAVAPDGRIRWESDLSGLTRALPSSFLLGDPVAIGNGNPTVTADGILVAVLYGYEVEPGRRILLPFRSAVAALSPDTGRALAEVVSLPDDSAGITAVLADGTIVSSLGGVLSSAISPLAPWLGWLLPGDLELLSPRGGLQVARPRTP
ncbi:MAG: PQQ-binding-like beta-propeller repeat protein [Myxococcota bacterium]|nr:PQQ-binding-like beta-propeller repeat protein [Myxococcota bacterium]